MQCTWLPAHAGRPFSPIAVTVKHNHLLNLVIKGRLCRSRGQQARSDQQALERGQHGALMREILVCPNAVLGTLQRRHRVACGALQRTLEAWWWLGVDFGAVCAWACASAPALASPGAGSLGLDLAPQGPSSAMQVYARYSTTCQYTCTLHLLPPILYFS